MTFVSSNPALASPRDEAADPWAMVDALLLVTVLIASSDMLIQFGPIQAVVWLAAYALTLLRIALLWPHFFALAARNRVVFAFPLVCFASVLWSFSPAESLVAALQLTMTMLIAMYLGWRYSLSVLIKALAIILTVAVVLSLLHGVAGIFPWPAHNRLGGLAGLFNSKNQLGQRSVIAVVAILTIWLMPRSEASPRFKLAMVVPMLLAMTALILSQSMTAVLMMPVLLAVWLVLGRHHMPRGIMVPVAGLAIVFGALGPVLLSIYVGDPVQAVLAAVGKSSTLSGRTLIWHVALDVIARHPLLGVGYFSFWHAPEFINGRAAVVQAGAVNSSSFHNFVLEILVSAGWLGVIAMLALLLAAATRLFRLYRAFGSSTAAGGLVMGVNIFVASLAEPSLYRPHEAMIVLLVALMVSGQEDYRARASLARPP